MLCKSCQKHIDSGRCKLGYTVCIECSTETAKKSVDIIYHKTGNTLEPMDSEKADKINKLAKRTGFGIMTGIRGSKTNTYNPKNVQHGASLSFTATNYTKVRDSIIELCDILEYDKILDRINRYYKNKEITTIEYKHLVQIVDIKFNITKPDIIEAETYINPEIIKVMKNWKNSKIYK